MPESLSDPFGKAFMAYHRGENAVFIIRRDDGYVDEQTLEGYFTEYEYWPPLEKEALAWVKGKVLDMGCGPGRHALWLQTKGFSVTGIDVSPMAVEVAMLRGVRDSRVMDARHLDFPPGSFDTVILMGNNLGVAGGIGETQEMLSRLRRIVTDNGLIIATTRNPLVTDNPRHLSYHECNRRRGLLPGLVTIRLEFRSEVGPWFDLLFVTREEMAQIIEPAGWRIERLYKADGGGGANYAAILTKK